MPVMLKTDSRAGADFQVCIVGNRRDAHLWVAQVPGRAEAGNPAYWFYTDSRADADHSIYIVASRAGADLNICYVETRGEAGWRVAEHPLKDIL